MKRTASLLLVGIVMSLLVGCGSGNADEKFDQNKIIKKQEGSGPPPLARPGDGKPAPPDKP